MLLAVITGLSPGLAINPAQITIEQAFKLFLLAIPAKVEGFCQPALAGAV